MQVRKITIVFCLIALMCILFGGCSRSVGNSDGQTDEEQMTLPEEESSKQEENEITPEEEQESVQEDNTDSEDKLPEEDAEEEQADREELIPITQAEFVSAKEMRQKVLARLKKDTVKTVYTRKYQDAVSKVIDKYKSRKEYSLEEPLFLYNPYGTMEQSMYLYYSSSDACDVSYSISVDNEAIPDYQGMLDTNLEKQTEHEGILPGVMPGMKNYITVTETNEAGETIRSQVFCLNLEKMAVNGQVLFTEDVNHSPKKLSDGVFWLLGSKESNKPGLQMMDECGIKRLVIPIDEPVNLDVEKVSEYLVYPKDSRTLVVLDRFGKADYLYSLGDYIYENDLRYNENTGCLYLIASDSLRESKADVVLAVNLGTGEVNVVMDFAQAVGEEQPLELNSLDFYGDNQLLVSSSGVSSIFCIDQIDQEPQLAYIISGNQTWTNSKVSQSLYQSIGSFDPFDHQSSIQVLAEDKRLIQGQYYIMMQSSTEQGDAYYKIFVDENTRTYTLAERLDLTSVQEGESIQIYEDHLICLMTQNVYEEAGTDTLVSNDQVCYEYNDKTEVIAEYHYEEQRGKINKVKKMNLSGIWN